MGILAILVYKLKNLEITLVWANSTVVKFGGKCWDMGGTCRDMVIGYM